jgi:hypothetical protein
VPMLAELVDAVVGVDSHRDTHEVEIALPTGTPIGTRKISNGSSGFAELLAWIVDRARGPRVMVSMEGTRGYGVGLARAVAAAASRSSSLSSPTARRAAGRASPTRSTLISRCSPPCVWMPTGSPCLGPTAIVRHCGSCSAPATSSAWPRPPRPTGSARCF